MTDRPYRVAFLGRGILGLRMLRRLLETPTIAVPLVAICRHTSEVGASEDGFAALASDHGVPLLRTERLNAPTSLAALRAAEIDLGVSVNWNRRIGRTAIDAAGTGILNCHGGLLPRYRGNACANWAILNGEQRTGVTIHMMDPEVIDGGPIVAQREIRIEPDMTIGALTEAIHHHGLDLMMDAIEQFRLGIARPRPQREEDAVRCYPRLPCDGEIDWKRPAEDIARLVRAVSHPYPGAYSYFADRSDGDRIKKLNIDAARAIAHDGAFCAVPGHVIKIAGGAERAVSCGDGRLLLLEVIRVDGCAIHPRAALRSSRQRLGLDTETILQALARGGAPGSGSSAPETTR